MAGVPNFLLFGISVLYLITSITTYIITSYMQFLVFYNTKILNKRGQEQIDKLNEISAANITLIDKVAPVKAIIRKMEDSLPKLVESEIIAYRKKYCAPADALHKRFQIPLWEVFGILDKYEDELRPLGLQRQEQDNYIKGQKDLGKVSI